MTNELILENVADDLDAVKTIMFTLARQYERIDRTVDRITIQQESNTQAIGSLNTQMDQLGSYMHELGSYMHETRAEILQTRTEMLQMQSEVREMQSEVRGLQVENRRIFQRAFGDEQF